jgi:hypothetical protein
VHPGAPGTSRHLADEVDLVFHMQPSKPVTFQIGYATFVPGGYITLTGDDPVAHFLQVQGRVKF